MTNLAVVTRNALLIIRQGICRERGQSQLPLTQPIRRGYTLAPGAMACGGAPTPAAVGNQWAPVFPIPGLRPWRSRVARAREQLVAEMGPRAPAPVPAGGGPAPAHPSRDRAAGCPAGQGS